MDRENQKLSQLEEQLIETIEKYPHNKNILLAFEPILLASKNLVGNSTCIAVDVSKIDKRRLQAGIPVSRQVHLFHPDEPWEELALAIIPSIKTGFPNLAEELRTIEEAVKKRTVQLKNYFTVFPDLKEESIQAWARILGIVPAPLHLFLISLLKLILRIKAKDITDYIENATWNKGYCPICGAFPEIAVIEDKITQRWLHCSRCEYEWRFNRISCPYCEHEGKEEGTTYFFIEGKEQETAFICEQCNRYLITLNRVSNLGNYDLDVVSMSLAHLDVIMQEKGFAPLALTEWNDFKTQP